MKVLSKTHQDSINAQQRQYRKENGNACTKKYEKTPKGFLMRVYRNMKSRVAGIQKQKQHLYQGKDLLPKDEFYAWAWKQKEFHRLFSEWTKADHDRRLTPSIDRIDSSRGYTVDNMRWLTHSMNSALGARQNVAAVYRALGLRHGKNNQT